MNRSIYYMCTAMKNDVYISDRSFGKIHIYFRRKQLITSYNNDL